ncbi:MAG: rRNA maturation RNase YbeY [Chloroflexi bacterium]|nr:rRNA maturation RNase YbeY [Chloroflexota bacterium]
MPSYDISLELGVDAPGVDVAGLQALAERVMSGEAVAEGTALAILITDDDEVRAMNLRFLGIDEPTDVLSFPDEADDFVQGMADEPLLGDIAIALPTAQRQAATAGHGTEAELAHLLVHGILHLCGFDHVNGGDEEARMRGREEHYLGADAFHHH